MRALLPAFVVLIAAGSIHARGAVVIPPDARIYVEAGSGFDMFLTAALEKKHVPITVTTDKSKANYALEGVSEQGNSQSVHGAAYRSEASVRLVNLQSGDVIFAWSVDRKSAFHSQQTAAEECVRRVVSEIAKSSQTGASGPSPLKNKVRDLYQSLSAKEPALSF